jgi:hypothetical protein
LSYPALREHPIVSLNPLFSIWTYLGSNEPMIWPTDIDGVTALTALGWGEKRNPTERKRWNMLFRTAIWCLWKCYLTVAWKEPYKLWSPEAAVPLYRTMLRRTILSEKVLAQNETYRNHHYNYTSFRKLWREDLRTLSIRKGSQCLIRIEPPRLDTELDEGEEESDGSQQSGSVGG